MIYYANIENSKTLKPRTYEKHIYIKFIFYNKYNAKDFVNNFAIICNNLRTSNLRKS
jgi:hypothetical protein